MIDAEFLKILCCPETKQPVCIADATLIHRLNTLIAAGQLKNRIGQILREPLESGLLREDRQWLYPIRKQIPIMLVDEAIPLPA